LTRARISPMSLAAEAPEAAPSVEVDPPEHAGSPKRAAASSRGRRDERIGNSSGREIADHGD
jgi:hypothetical protein